VFRLVECCGSRFSASEGCSLCRTTHVFRACEKDCLGLAQRSILPNRSEVGERGTQLTCLTHCCRFKLQSTEEVLRRLTLHRAISVFVHRRALAVWASAKCPLAMIFHEQHLMSNSAAVWVQFVCRRRAGRRAAAMAVKFAMKHALCKAIPGFKRTVLLSMWWKGSYRYVLLRYPRR
jgi:hypothetical protein